MGFSWVFTQLRVGLRSIILLNRLGLISFLYFFGGCEMDIKVTIFWYGWTWVGFFVISRPTSSSQRFSHKKRWDLETGVEATWNLRNRCAPRRGFARHLFVAVQWGRRAPLCHNKCAPIPLPRWKRVNQPLRQWSNHRSHLETCKASYYHIAQLYTRALHICT
jgi:hypothetical protein